MKTIFFILIILLAPTETFYLNYILNLTNKGKIWRKDLGKPDKRAAAVALSQVLTWATLALLWLGWWHFFGGTP